MATDDGPGSGGETIPFSFRLASLAAAWSLGAVALAISYPGGAGSGIDIFGFFLALVVLPFGIACWISSQLFVLLAIPALLFHATLIIGIFASRRRATVKTLYVVLLVTLVLDVLGCCLMVPGC
jgi:hypothetical protein